MKDEQTPRTTEEPVERLIGRRLGKIVSAEEGKRLLREYAERCEIETARDLRERLANLAAWHEDCARRDREAAAEMRPTNAGATGAMAGYITSAVAHDTAARRIREELAT